MPFRIFKVQSDGDLHFVEAFQTFGDAKACVRELGEVRPGEYVIENEETGERIFVSTRDERKNRRSGWLSGTTFWRRLGDRTDGCCSI